LNNNYTDKKTQNNISMNNFEGLGNNISIGSNNSSLGNNDKNIKIRKN
jgi:hypothetical protein